MRTRHIDISTYGSENSKEEIRDFLSIDNLNILEFEGNIFIFLILTITALHNLFSFELEPAI
jgi:hypothetical protein